MVRQRFELFEFCFERCCLPGCLSTLCNIQPPQHAVEASAGEVCLLRLSYFAHGISLLLHFEARLGEMAHSMTLLIAGEVPKGTSQVQGV